MPPGTSELGPGMKALGMGFTLAITIFVCGMIGYYIGRNVSEFAAVAGLTCGLLFGLFGGLYQAYKIFG